MQINTQEPMKIDRQEDGAVYVHSIFRTIQGEGPFAGHAALFIRLTGCNLQCPGCDTEYTKKSNLTDRHTLLDIIRAFYDWQKGLIVITGGEPFRQNITPLVQELLAEGYKVQVESNGVLHPGEDFPWHDPNFTLVISPKTGKIHPKTAQLAYAFKYVLSRDNVAPDGLPTTALNHPLGTYSTVARPPVGWNGPVYVNPMDAQDENENRANMQAVVDTVMANPGYIMGVQMHKLTGLP